MFESRMAILLALFMVLAGTGWGQAQPYNFETLKELADRSRYPYVEKLVYTVYTGAPECKDDYKKELDLVIGALSDIAAKGVWGGNTISAINFLIDLIEKLQQGYQNLLSSEEQEELQQQSKLNTEVISKARLAIDLCHNLNILVDSGEYPLLKRYMDYVDQKAKAGNDDDLRIWLKTIRVALSEVVAKNRYDENVKCVVKFISGSMVFLQDQYEELVKISARDALDEVVLDELEAALKQQADLTNAALEEVAKFYGAVW